jgi:hypothetical protein
MSRCETCGNDYDRPIVVLVDGQPHTFDCFECAIHALAPRCAHCGCRVIGHGVGARDRIYCCEHCERAHDSTNASEPAYAEPVSLD